VSAADFDDEVREAMKGPPSGYFVVVPEPQGAAGDDLAAFTGELLAAWRLLLATAFAGGLIAAVAALLLPPKFRAEALLAPSATQTSPMQGGALRQLSGLAALADIDLGAGGGRKEEALATLNSLGFAREFIRANNLLPLLYAERWDAAAGRWRSDAKPPTLGEAAKRFRGDVLSVSDDRRTGFVTVTVDWYAPQLAAQWANGLVAMVNDKLRAEAIDSSQRSLEYLDRELAKTNVVEIRQAIYRLIEQQVNNAMLANVQREYAYRFLDAAVAPESRFTPKRTLMSAVGGACGLFFGVMAVYLRRLRRRGRGRRGAPS
jgi:uncharacterized protein involved in exopolysaccharide biosynthesis